MHACAYVCVLSCSLASPSPCQEELGQPSLRSRERIQAADAPLQCLYVREIVFWRAECLCMHVLLFVLCNNWSSVANLMHQLERKNVKSECKEVIKDKDERKNTRRVYEEEELQVRVALCSATC